MRDNEKLNKLLQIKSEQVRAGAQLLINKTRDWQVIRQYLSNRIDDIVLTYDQQRKLERYQFIYSNLSSGKYMKFEVINMTMKIYGIEQRQVYEDINCTQEIFSSVLNINKLFELQLELQSARDMKRKCIEVNDIKTAAMVQKNITAIIEMLPDEDVSQGEDFEGHEFNAVFDPRLLGSPEIDMMEVLTSINAKRKVKIKTDMFEKISFEENTNEKTDPLQ